MLWTALPPARECHVPGVGAAELVAETAISGHANRTDVCLLSGVKQTSK